jgi:hypothetical protein
MKKKISVNLHIISVDLCVINFFPDWNYTEGHGEGTEIHRE